MSSAQEMDPFSQVYNTLWNLATESALLRSLVRVGNMIKFNDPSWITPQKAQVSDADLPELALLVTAASGRIRASSSGSQAVLTCDWWLSTGDPSVIRNCLPVMWAVYAAMVPWPNLAQSAVLWKGKPFIKRVDLLTANFALTDPEKNRGIRGWSCVWSCETEMYFQTSDVIASSQLQ